MRTLKIGDTVTYRPSFGSGAPIKVKIEDMEITDSPFEKYGESVEEVNVDLVRANRVCFGFDNESWAYSDQIDL